VREENEMGVIRPFAGVPAENMRGSGMVSRLHSSMRSVASGSTRVGYLVRRAMTYLETDREAAWRCLSDASHLLGTESEESRIQVSRLSRALPPGGLAAWQAKRTLAYIEEHLGSKVTIQELATQVALSKSHFSRAFKSSLGSSPMAYVSMRRIEHAKIMMTSTRERLTDIALACGFSDQSHLNRYFRRIVGVSPGLWRRSVTMLNDGYAACAGRPEPPRTCMRPWPERWSQ
jgi:AraC family transcriptional regulator